MLCAVTNNRSTNVLRRSFTPHSSGISLRRKPLIATPPSLVFFCCEVLARVNCSFYKGLPHTQLDQHLSHDRHEWPSILCRRVKSRSEGRSVIKPPLLAIAACYRSRYKTRGNASFYLPAEIPLESRTIDSPTGHTRLFRFWLSYFHRHGIDNAGKRYRINGNHFTPTLRFD